MSLQWSLSRKTQSLKPKTDDSILSESHSDLSEMLLFDQAYCGNVNPEDVNAFAFMKAKEQLAGTFDHDINNLFRQVSSFSILKSPDCISEKKVASYLVEM